jgi:gas vesicle protein
MEYARYEEQNRQPMKSSNAGPGLIWLLVGLGVGAGAALLFAPRSGRDLRSSITFGCRRAMDGISRGTQELRQHGSNLLRFGRYHAS